MIKLAQPTFANQFANADIANDFLKAQLDAVLAKWRGG